MKFNELFKTRLTEKTELAKQKDELKHDDPSIVPSAEDEKEFSKKDHEGHHVWLVVDKRFGFNIVGKFYVLGIHSKRDGIEVDVDKRIKSSGKIFIPFNRSGTKFVSFDGLEDSTPAPIAAHDVFKLFHKGLNEGKKKEAIITLKNHDSKHFKVVAISHSNDPYTKVGDLVGKPIKGRDSAFSKDMKTFGIGGPNTFKVVMESSVNESKMAELHAAIPEKWKDIEIAWGGEGKNTGAKYAIIKHDGEKYDIFVKMATASKTRYPYDTDWHQTPYNTVKSGEFKSLADAKEQIKNAVKPDKK